MRERVATEAPRGEWEAGSEWSDVSEEDGPLARWLGRGTEAIARSGPRYCSDGPVVMDSLRESEDECSDGGSDGSA